MVTAIQGMLVTVIGVYVHFWIWGNLMGTIKILAVLFIPSLFAARMGLSAVAYARAETKKKDS
jgi:multisubunit Na+/H+ antiporter MnhG subunit